MQKMARQKPKWKFVFILQIVMLNVFIKSLPLDKTLRSVPTVETKFNNIEETELSSIQIASIEIEDVDSQKERNSKSLEEAFTVKEIEYTSNQDESFESLEVNSTTNEDTDIQSEESSENEELYSVVEETSLDAQNSFLRQVRPGQTITDYKVEITFDGDSINGRVEFNVIFDTNSMDDPIKVHVDDLDIHNVWAGILTSANLREVSFNVDGEVLEINPDVRASQFVVVIEYSGRIHEDGKGIFQREFQDITYIAMNLNPTYARRVFPCMDEPSEGTLISFIFNEVPFQNIVINSLPEDGSSNEFRALPGPPHRWGMVAHNFQLINIPISNVRLHGRPLLRNQDIITSLAINDFFSSLEEWTGKPYFEIVVDQNNELNIFGLPDTSVDWVALSSVCIWEPYIFMETDHSVKQRKTALVTIAEALARQWFGYAIYPENWRNQWVISGLASHAAYDVLHGFQSSNVINDVTLLDINTIFTVDVIQESLYWDGYTNSQPLEPGDDMFDKPDIRDHINGLLKYKSPAMMRMLRIMLGREDDDFIRTAAGALLQNRPLDTINTINFYDAINGYWSHSDYQLIENVEEFLEPWITERGYPLIHVGTRQGGVIITQESFGFSQTGQTNYHIPLSFTQSYNFNFETENVFDLQIMETTTVLNIPLDEEEFVLFNIQGQGYYRVNYDGHFWELIIEALNDPDQREEIHPLNRATLVDDALNLARAGKLDYDIALQVVLSMEHEIDYAVWKAFVRNMNFLRKRLVALVTEDEDLDPDIYLRMVRRTVGRVEEELGFDPDPLLIEPAMHSLTRGLVMDHACRANYDPCIAAAVDWFYEDDAVNPDIPSEIRPAVFCTMVREGGQDVIDALYDHLENEESHYERLVILESLACSQDEDFINSYLTETIADGSPYGVEERSKIFAAVAESSYQNAHLAMNFMNSRVIEIRNMYGGPEKLEQLIYILAENIADDELAGNFEIFVIANNNNLDDSQDAAERAKHRVDENMEWNNAHMEAVYEWIDENDASTMVVSLVLICLTFMVTLFNN